jgi:AcrR family transcriptional regulator
LRVRTEARRRAILEAARSVFRETGFDRATMSAISDRLGGSKATLYGYFPSKEELFMAVIEDEIEQELDARKARLDSIGELRAILEYLGRGVLTTMTGTRPLAIYRMLASQPADSRVGRDFYEGTVRPAWQDVANILGDRMARGELRPADPWTAAMHLKGLIEGPWIDQRMLDIMPDLKPDEVSRAALVAVDAFLRAYGAGPYARYGFD